MTTARPRAATRATRRIVTPRRRHADGGHMPQRIRVNTATEQELLEVPGLRPADASAIVRFRDEHGPTKHAAQLSSVLAGRELDETPRPRVHSDPANQTGPEATGA